MTTEISIFNPEILKTAVELSNNNFSIAETKFNKLKAKIDATNIAELGDERLVELDSNMNNYVVEFSKLGTDIEATRKPITAKLDEYKKIFTTAENSIKGFVTEFNKFRSEIATEILNRNRAKEIEQQAQVAKSNEKVLILESFGRYMAAVGNSDVSNFAKECNKILFSKNALELGTYDFLAVPFNKSNPIDSYEVPKYLHHTSEEVMSIIRSNYTEREPKYLKWLDEQINIERNRFNSLIPSRVIELQNGSAAENREQQEAEKITQREEIRAIDLSTQVDQEAAQSELAAAFTIDAVNSKTEIKGAKTKQEYVVETAEGMAAIISWYFKNIVGSLSIEELNKKFSFAVTAANIELNAKDGLTIESKGLIVKEKVTVRKTSFK